MSAPFDGEVVLVGCGRLGSAILEGWLATGAVDPDRLIILTPSEKPAADAAAAKGVRVNPPLDALGAARAIVLAVKPVAWRAALTPLAPHLSAGAVIVSVMAGVPSDAIVALAGRPVARLMPTTAVAQGQGVAALWSIDAAAAGTARTLFAPLADIVALDAEDHMDAATAVAGSAPAFVHAFVQALARAGEGHGLPPQAATRLARGALRSAAAGLEGGATLDALIARIASPGGTTRAGLDAMADKGALDAVARAAVDTAVSWAKTL